jgi:rhodanese-related sulfurtransferase
MAEERRRNPALCAPDEETFVREQLTGLLSYPTYYSHMASINRTGPPVFGGRRTHGPPRLTPAEVEARLRTGIPLVDGRWRVQFARAHVAGSVNVELDDSFGNYVGWVVPFAEAVMLVLPEPEEDAIDQAVTQLFRIGYERIEGYLQGGVEAWRATGRPVASYGVAGLEHLCRASKAGAVRHILDVRQEVEWDGGHIAGSQHVFVGDVPDRLQEIPRDAQVWAICRTGHRSSIAASLLDREGIDVRLVDGTGVDDFLKHCAPELREPAGHAGKSEGT